MFYSTQILAKKGPLGTIWIAAHLDKRLKRNQVFEANIAISVGEFADHCILIYHELWNLADESCMYCVLLPFFGHTCVSQGENCNPP